MTVTAPVTAPGPVAATAALAKLLLPLPQSGAAPSGAARPPDHVDLSPPPTLRTLWELAFTGSQQLDVLLPTLERMLRPDAEPMPFAVGHLARAVGDAAHKIDSGAANLADRDDPTGPSPALLDGWRQTARTVLHTASDVLTRAEDRLTPLAIDKNPEALWALTQVAGAQRQVGTTLGDLNVLRAPPLRLSGPQPRRSTANLNGATAALGLLLLLLVYALASGMWLTAAGLISLGVALVWLWRAVVAARNLRIELRH